MHPSNSHFFSVFLLAGFILTANATPASAVEPANFNNEIRELEAASDAVIIGSIERRDIDIAQTIAVVRVDKSFSGSLKSGQSIKFVTRAGRVQVGKNQPELTGIDRAVFYLTPDSNEIYRCTNDNYGFKPIIHDNVYTNPQNPLETVKLKKYQESLLAYLNSKAS